MNHPSPTIIFSPPDISVNQASPAGAQFMSMFNDPAAWQVTANMSAGLGITEAFVLLASTQQLSQVLAYVKQHSMKLIMTAGMIPVQANGLGNALEGFTTQAPLLQSLQRIASLGGTVDAIAMDEPLAAGHEDATGPQLSITALAEQVATNVALVKSVFPNVQFEDGENLRTAPDLDAWAAAFKAATGSQIALFGADVDWSMPGLKTALETYAADARAAGASLGLIGDANGTAPTDQAWALAAESNIAKVMADPLVSPSDIGITTFGPNPTSTLPEGLSGTLAHVALEAAEVAPLYANGTLSGAQGLTVSTTAPAPSYTGAALDAVGGAAVAVPGVSIGVAGGAPAGTIFAVVVTDVSGALGAAASGAGQVSNAAPNVLLLTGDLADINAELASLTYQGASAGTDTIDITTYDGAGLVDDHTLPVTIETALPVTLPGTLSATSLYDHIFGAAPSAAALAPVQAGLAQGETLSEAASGWLAQAQSTLAMLSDQIVGVSPSASALEALVAALAGGEALGQIRVALASSAAVQAELQSLYTSCYGAAPSSAQRAALTQALASGSLQSVEAPMLASSAAEAQVTSLYQQVEGAAPDASDLAAQARALLQGTPLATLRAQLAASAGVQATLAAMFQHVYDAAPTGTQLAALTAQLAGAATLAQINAQFTATVQSMVAADYQSALDRAPTATELDTYVNQIMGGIYENSTVLRQLAFSAESTANVTALYQSVVGQVPSEAMTTTLEQCLAIGQIPLPQLQTDLAEAASLYQQVTGQPATEAALSPLMYDVLNGATAAQLSNAIAFSGQENRLIETLYQTLFGSPITPVQLTGIETALANGSTTMAAVQTTLAAQAAADVPVLSDIVANQTDYANTWIAPFGAVTLTDTNPTAVETMTVTLSGGDGRLGGVSSNLNASDTVYTRVGSAAMLQGDLRALYLIDPNAHSPGTASLSVSVSNSAGNSVSGTVTIATLTQHLPATSKLVFMPAGNDTVSGGSGETFMFPQGGFGVDEIKGFNPAEDVIQFSKAQMPSYSALLPDETASTGGITLAIGPSESIFLPGLSLASLSATNFSFV